MCCLQFQHIFMWKETIYHFCTWPLAENMTKQHSYNIWNEQTRKHNQHTKYWVITKLNIHTLTYSDWLVLLLMLLVLYLVIYVDVTNIFAVFHIFYRSVFAWIFIVFLLFFVVFIKNTNIENTSVLLSPTCGYHQLKFC